ncbi:hypothetical protein D3C73_1507010 [compost metagenome]
MFIGCLHSATLDESQMIRSLQPSLSALSSTMQDIREVLARCAREGDDERVCESDPVLEVRAAGDDDIEDR